MVELGRKRFATHMDVLLVSPKDPKVPSSLKFLMGGENTYTHSLLKNPPQGVRYTHHLDAARKGEIEYTHWQPFLQGLIKTRMFPMDTGYHCIRLKKNFDLIHCHGYSLKVDGDLQPPVVLGDSSSNVLFLRDYLRWHPLRINAQYALRRYTHRVLNVYDRDVHVDQCAVLIVFSEFAKKVHVELGADAHKIVMIPPGLPKREMKRNTNTKHINILFAGVWFERKGGRILLQAYRLLRKKYPQVRLTILGPLPKAEQGEELGITHYDFVSYKRLIREFYPRADVFVLVPPVAEGFGMVVLEAASFGIPTIVSSIYALPELVAQGETGLVIKPGSVYDLMHALETLIAHPTLRARMGREARKRFIERFSIEVTNRALLNVYNAALTRHSQVFS